MRALQQLLPSKNKSNSLFMNLLLGFLTIIVLLVTVHFISISISSDQVRSEIIKYNTLNLNNTVESYEKHYELVRRTLISFIIHEEVQNFRRERRYIKFPDIQQEIRQVISNPLLYIQDIILYNHTNAQILNKDRSTNAMTMFTVFMQDDVYTLGFWEQQFSEPYKEKLLAATPFVDHTYFNQPLSTDLLFPVVFKTHESDWFYIIAMLDARKMFEEFHVSINDNLTILDGDRILYPNTEASNQEEMPELPKDGREYVLANDRYYFYQKGSATGFTYVQQVPMEDISAQSTMIATLMFILFLAIAISIFAAWLFIRRINNPLKQVIESLQSMNINQPVQSNIKEFRTISHQFARLAREKQNDRYMKQLKDIHQSDVTGLHFSNQPYVLLLFDFVFKDRSEEVRETENKWYLYVKEFIDISITLKYENAFVFRIEKNQILCLIYLDEQGDLLETLEKVKTTLDFDQTVGYATIAVSSEYQHSSELTKAYEEVLDKLHHRPYSDETVIILEQVPRMSYSGFSIDQEQQFDVHLREGNASLAMKVVQKVLDEFKQQHTSTMEVESFAKIVIDKCFRQLTTYNIGADEQQQFYRDAEKIHLCYTFQELGSFLEDYIRQVCEQIDEQKEKTDADYIVAYITQYVEDHYDEEVYLDDLADKLKMSSGYLSVYFKNMTGNNFIDYLNGFRISKAQELLLATDWKVKDIADKVGYQNINSFNRMFKRFTGVTPGEYRKKKTS